MRRTYKDVFNDAYYEAIEGGCSQQQAEHLAGNAAQHFIEQQLEWAERLREDALMNPTTPASAGKDL
jgi:hypothetical protein